jgi:hypothetical protein
MNFPAPMPTAEQLPCRLDGHPYAADDLAYDAKARQWFVASFMFDDFESKTAPGA